MNLTPMNHGQRVWRTTPAGGHSPAASHLEGGGSESEAPTVPPAGHLEVRCVKCDTSWTVKVYECPRADEHDPPMFQVHNAVAPQETAIQRAQREMRENQEVIKGPVDPPPPPHQPVG